MSRNFVFTINNYTEGDLEYLIATEKNVFVKGISYQSETGVGQTPHIQGYIEFTKVFTNNQAERLLGGRAWLANRKGNRDQAIAYTQKSSTFNGDLKFCNLSLNKGGQGCRNDLKALRKSLDDGTALKEISELHFREFLLYNRNIRDYIILHHRPRDWKMEVYVFWGDPGTGKTRKVFEYCKGERIFSVSPPNGDTVWWDGYDGETIILIDDFYGWLKWSFLLQLLDRYQFMVPIKGGFKCFMSKRIYFTSNVHPDHWYNYSEKIRKDALFRRITKITEFRKLINT